ncbi:MULTISPECIES: competence/damage-inducible protein A [Clostridia]|uniref:competence/damage-inducible protein A n=1 Tax=Clostridia TaxID=186801 RepID=UPI000EA06F29|nr:MULTISPECIES: competence/damage-inducible protein A [Clostridia]NBJ68325.1 competence/damage-inducible protein A [Roseburia sp. 1XD42-34]RKI81415.1 competence/damage-inducible protein A [Clostridium sp. 1xD42-85]
MTKDLQAEIVAVGTELLLGQIANTNAQWLSQQLANQGVNVYRHTTVGDNLQRVQEAFNQAHERSDIVIVTGGLGPTEDDLTREAFQQLSHIPLVQHRPSMDKIQAYFEKQQAAMTPNNPKQARVFEGATVWLNPVGMAPGMKLTYDNCTWIFLPGVPREMKALVREYMIPALQQLLGKKEMIKSIVLKFTGIGESKLEHELQDIIHEQTNPTIAPLAQEDGIVIRLTAKSESLQQADQLLEATKAKIFSRVGNYAYGEDHETLEGKVVGLLTEQELTLATAESLTGGAFSDKISTVPGASKVLQGGIVSYTNEVKEHVLDVPKNILETKGAVSKECAEEMAKQAANKLSSTIGIAFTGVAGPIEMEGKQVGTVYIAIYNPTGTSLVKRFLFQGDRNSIRRRTVLKGLELLYRTLK